MALDPSVSDNTTTLMSTVSQEYDTSMVPSTSVPSLNESTTDEANFQYDFDFDLKALRNALKADEYLDESGYHSVMARSQHSQYGTGWMVADSMSVCSNNSSTDEWDGYITVGTEKIKIKDLSDILASRYAFLSGARTRDGFPLLTFPDSRVQLSYPDYHRLTSYLVQVPPLEDSHQGYVIVVDRRLDKWSAVRMLLVQLCNYFPCPIRVVFVLKPEGVLQRALEVGYRAVADSCRFKVVLCQNVYELHQYLGRDCLTLDFGGSLKYSHLEWVQHRMDIERMKASATVIAKSLSEFSRCLKDTELPNDVETTAHVLDTQRAEKDAIKEDFRIAVRKGMALLKNVRQVDTKPKAEQLSPTRLHNVTSIERMIIQLDETERSFDSFWCRHESRLVKCLELRRFEEEFRKLQANFARHMIYLEEHREIGDCPEKAEQLQQVHEEYIQKAQDDVNASNRLRIQGQELNSVQDPELEGSLLPKCDELTRMTDALNSALQRRLQVLKLSKTMHEQIEAANDWCSRGVQLLSDHPYELANKDEVIPCLRELDTFVEESADLDMSSLEQGPDLHNLIVLTTTETSTLLQQVNARINDVKKMCEGRRTMFQRVLQLKDKLKPIQAVSPEKHSTCSSNPESSPSPEKPALRHGSIELHTPFEAASFFLDSPETPSHNQANYVINELVTTEENYVLELESVLKHYFYVFNDCNTDKPMVAHLKEQKRTIFANLDDICYFHRNVFLKSLTLAAQQPQKVIAIAQCFLEHRDRFFLYNVYCQNKTKSDKLLQEIESCSDLLQDCKRQAGHLLPLSAYLLKPVQRITKYQLILKELNKHTGGQISQVCSALEVMLELLDQLNASLNQTHIYGYSGEISNLGPVVCQAKFNIWHVNNDRGSSLKLRRTNRIQRRELFLFNNVLLLCKSKAQSAPSCLPEYYEYKNEIPLHKITLTEQVKGSPGKFQLYTEGRQDVYTLQAPDKNTRNEWITKLKHQMISAEDASSEGVRSRPHSWASGPTGSFDSCSSEQVLTSTADTTERPFSSNDSNGNRDINQETGVVVESGTFLHNGNNHQQQEIPEQFG